MEFFSDTPDEEEVEVENKETKNTSTSTNQQASTFQPKSNLRPPMTLSSARPETVTMVRHPRSYDECREVGRDLKSGKSVVLDLSALHDSDAQKFIDFVSGVVFALDGELCPVHGRVYIAAPQGIKVDNKVQKNDAGVTDELAPFSTAPRPSAATGQDTFWQMK